MLTTSRLLVGRMNDRRVERARPRAGGRLERRLHVGQIGLLEVEREVVAEVRPLHVDQHAVAEHVLIAELPERAGAGQSSRTCRSSLSTAFWRYGGLDRAQVAGVARVAHLLRPGVLEVEAVVLERHAGDLPVVVVQRRQVGLETVAQRLGVGECAGSAARRRDGRSGVVLVEADHADLDVLRAVAAPEPRAALADRAADLEAVVLDVLDRRCRTPAPCARRSSVMLFAWNDSSVTVVAARALKRSVPLLVTRLMPTPPVCCVTSAPPVVTCISWSMSKS